MASEAPAMSPQSIGALVKQTFRLYGRRFWLFFGLAAIASVPSQVVSAMFQLQVQGLAQGAANRDIISLFVGFFIWFSLILAISLLLFALLQMALIRAVSESYQMRNAGIAWLYRFALGRLGTLAGAWSLVGLVFLGLAIPMMVGGFLFLLGLVSLVISAVDPFLLEQLGVPATVLKTGLPLGLFGALGVIGSLVAATSLLAAIYFAVRWWFIPQAVVQERAGIRSSISRSSSLVRGSWWRSYGAIFLFGLLSGAGSLTGTALVGLLLSGREPAALIIRGLFEGIIQAIASPIFVLGTTLFYYDLRVRKEGYNLEVMAQELARA